MVVAKSKPFIRRRHRSRHQLDKSSSHCHNLHAILMSPVLALDYCISTMLWLHTMMFQFSLYGLYLALYLFCHATGHTHKLERSEEERLKDGSITSSCSNGVRRTRRKRSSTDQVRKEDYGQENDSGYLSDSDPEEAFEETS